MGLASKEQLDGIENILDDLVDFSKASNFFVKKIEWVDGKFFRAAFEYVDDQLEKVLPEELKPEYEKFLNYLINKNWIGCMAQLPKFENFYIDIPKLDEGQESIIFTGVNRIIIDLINYKKDELKK